MNIDQNNLSLLETKMINEKIGLLRRGKSRTINKN
jgi:hypothetical protein